MAAVLGEVCCCPCTILFVNQFLAQPKALVSLLPLRVEGFLAIIPQWYLVPQKTLIPPRLRERELQQQGSS